jgi:hypothetical protein
LVDGELRIKSIQNEYARLASDQLKAVESLQAAGDLKLQAGMPAEVYIEESKQTALQIPPGTGHIDDPQGRKADVKSRAFGLDMKRTAESFAVLVLAELVRAGCSVSRKNELAVLISNQSSPIA